MIHKLTKNSIAVEVPADSRKHCITASPDKEGIFCIQYETVPIDDAPSWDISDNLPLGSWQILGRVNKLTEEQAAEVVKKDEEGYWVNYNWKSWQSNSTEDSALESFQSLLASKNVPIDNVIILVKL